ncbi:hypothetical protein FPHYL_8048 [Fusarium phyllophilum]|uniref:Fungal N-terminal domain-containing protein n=1 Tax=Fusarium phyllophilum TaxID=47803 RepID=A0A8H5JIR5_9HYPO|nr:hypothetical protein FPHYL_8048 [Fusarium phyllophilum]
MDPVSTIGLASGILTFVEAGLKLVKIAYNIYNSLDGVTDDNRHRESVTSEVSKAALRLEVAGNARLTPEQQSLSDLTKKCKATSTELVKVLNEVKPKQISSNPFKSLRYAVKANVKTKDINSLENQLRDYRDQLILALVDFSRVEAANGFADLISLAKGNEATLKSLTQAMEHMRQSQLSAPQPISNTQAFCQFQRWIYETTGVTEEDGEVPHVKNARREVLKLRGACGGLIECHESTQLESVQVLEFVHRSVPDMFCNNTENSQLPKRMKVALDGTNTIDFVSHLCFATLRLSGQTGRRSDMERSVCQSIVLMRFKERIDRPPYHLIENISLWVDDGWLDDNQAKWLYFVAPVTMIQHIKLYQSASMTGYAVKIFFNNMRLAVLSGCTDYIQWKISNDAKAMNNSIKRALVGQAILTSKYWELFFQNDIFTMDPTIPLTPAVHTQLLNGHDMTGSDSCSLSAWQFYLTYVILRLNYQRSTLPENMGNVVDQFLRRGADPYCRILVAFEEDRVSLTIYFRESKTLHAVPRTSSNLLCGHRLKGIIEGCLKLRGDPLVDWDKEFTREFLFREWIAVTDLSDRDTLLALLE